VIPINLKGEKQGLFKRGHGKERVQVKNGIRTEDGDRLDPVAEPGERNIKERSGNSFYGGRFPAQSTRKSGEESS